MKARTVSAIQTEAAYLRHRIERAQQALETAPLRDLGELNTVLSALRNALSRTEVELGAQGQTNIEMEIPGAMEFSLS